MLLANGTVLCSVVDTLTSNQTSMSASPAGAAICGGGTAIQINGSYLIATQTVTTTTSCFLPAASGVLHASPIGNSPVWAWVTPDGGGGYQPFSPSNARSVTLTPIGSDALVVTVPLVSGGVST
jgi:hypothetical protein